MLGPLEDPSLAIDPDLLDPHPDIHGLFMHYQDLYFEGLLGGVSVEWSSKRMTMCGGTCQKVPGGAIIKLSEPLLKFRPSKELKEVLLHEMIHAYCMVNGIRDEDPGGHGTPFQTIMHRINRSSLPADYHRPAEGYNITITHTMFAEVEHYRQHHWECDKCGDQVRRAMNRPPQEADCRSRAGSAAACRDTQCRFHMHVKRCGGKYVKTNEPEGYKDSKAKKAKTTTTTSNKGGGSGGPVVETFHRRKKPDDVHQRSITDFLAGTGRMLGTKETDTVASLENKEALHGNNSNSSSVAVHPALAAITIGSSSGRQPEQHEQAAMPSLDERRRLAAEAASRRAISNTTVVARVDDDVGGRQHMLRTITTLPVEQEQRQQQQKGPYTEGSIESIDILSSSSEDEGQLIDVDKNQIDLVSPKSPPGHMQQKQQQGHMDASAREHVTTARRVGGLWTVPSRATVEDVKCPVCGQVLGKEGSIGNVELNVHIDACLAGT